MYDEYTKQGRKAEKELLGLSINMEDRPNATELEGTLFIKDIKKSFPGASVWYDKELDLKQETDFVIELEGKHYCFDLTYRRKVSRNRYVSVIY